MSALNHILDAPLPKNRNFDELKSDGLQHVQDLSGTNWTDFNESDPGVTTLDQLCYALTELGYCSSFSIEDILTQSDGKIDYKSQFYFPNEIFTRSPVTINDYRKILVDRIEELRNVYIVPEKVKSTKQNQKKGCTDKVNNQEMEGPLKYEQKTGRYQVFLYATPNCEYKDDPNLQIIDQAVFVLNAHRNIGECFIKPKSFLKPVHITLSGKIRIDDSISTDDIISTIKQSLLDYVSPPFIQEGYRALHESGLSSDEIFNGPELANGWMQEDKLISGKLECVSINDISDLLGSLSAVTEIISLKMMNSEKKQKSKIPVSQDQIPLIEIDVNSFHFLKSHPSPPKPTMPTGGLNLHTMKYDHALASIGATVDLTPTYPSGKFRSIEEYYSIQNTFPDQYGIGYNALQQSSASSYRTAQTRQFKGYLMVYDQLLANQFSQLANVANLFSFETRGRYFDSGEQWYSWMPYRFQDQTYFCQPLYDVPDVKPLLLGSDAFDFSIDQDASSAIWQAGWIQFKKDPFNEYVSGLREKMECRTVVDDRQTRMLDHLLARHGESGSLIDGLITNARWLGSLKKSSILVKRIILQNYQLISYNRSKGYDFLAAEKLCLPGRYKLSEGEHRRLQQEDIDAELLNDLVQIVGGEFSNKDSLLLAIYKFLEPNYSPSQIAALFKRINIADEHKVEDAITEIDGWFDTERLESSKKLSPQDFSNFSTFELLANLILGLTDYYYSLASMMIQIVDDPGFRKWSKIIPQASKSQEHLYKIPDCNLGVRRETNHYQILDGDEYILTVEIGPGRSSVLSSFRDHIDQFLWLSRQRKGMILVESVLLQGAITPNLKPGNPEITLMPVYLIFPGYIKLIKDSAFHEYIAKLASAYWPLHIAYQPKNPSFDDLKSIIQQYVKLHNTMRYVDTSSVKEAPEIKRDITNPKTISAAKALINLLVGSRGETS